MTRTAHSEHAPRPASQTPRTVDRVVDARHLKCPLPTLRAKQALRELGASAVITVHATDPQAREELRRFAARHGHVIVADDLVDGVITITLARDADQ